MTDGGREKNFDAYTKLSGEMQRFLCVRKHIRKIRNKSRFFYRSTTRPDMVRAVKFKSLWLHWKKPFGKQYNIPDSAIREAIRVSKLKSKLLPVARMTGDDYELQS